MTEKWAPEYQAANKVIEYKSLAELSLLRAMHNMYIWTGTEL